MSRVRTFLLPIQLSIVLSLSAQSDVHQQLFAAGQLVLQGHFENAIERARPLLESRQLTDLEHGRGWTVLGLAYQHQGEFQEATSAYENAIRILGERNENAADFASALDAFGTLYRDMLQFDNAAHVEIHALHVDQQINDHGGIAVDPVLDLDSFVH
jgi:tetratricopeptide (TPR) repeat protein